LGLHKSQDDYPANIFLSLLVLMYLCHQATPIWQGLGQADAL